MLAAVALLNAACWLFSDFVQGTLRSLVDAPAFLACLAAALTVLIGNARQVVFAAAAVLGMVLLIVGSFYLLLLGCSL